MASSKAFYTDGMTVDEILNLGDDILSKLSKRDLSRALRTVSLAANKRVDRLLSNVKKTKTGYKAKTSAKHLIATDALNAITNDGKLSPKFGVGNKNRNQIYAELARARSFMGYKTSTLKGAEEVRRARDERIMGMTYEQYLKDAKKKLKKHLGKKPTKKDLKKLESSAIKSFTDKVSDAYALFRKFNEMQGVPNFPYRNYQGSHEVLEMIGQRTMQGDSDEDVLRAAEKALEESYEKQIEDIADMLETDDPFELISDDDNSWGIEI